MPKFIPEFSSLLADLSNMYSGRETAWLRLLLNDHCAGETLGKKGVSGIILFNELADKGYISFLHGDFEILLDIAKVTEKADAEKLITTFQKKHPKTKQKYNFAKNQPLTAFRKRLFKTVRKIKDCNIDDVATFYEIRQYQYTSFWDLVFDLEKQLKLKNTKNSIKLFANQINNEASKILLDGIDAAGVDNPDNVEDEIDAAGVDNPDNAEDDELLKTLNQLQEVPQELPKDDEDEAKEQRRYEKPKEVKVSVPKN